MINHASSEKTKGIFSAKQLAFCGVSIGLAFVLSNIKFFKFPTGGSITAFSMLVACLPAFWFGPLVGVISGVAYGLLNLIVDPYILYPAQVIVDYILAFGAFGLAGFFSKSNFGLLKGYIVAILGRYFFSVISGWIFFGEWAWKGWNPLTYSLAYNAIYIFAEAGVTLILFIIPAFRILMDYLKHMATSK